MNMQELNDKLKSAMARVAELNEKGIQLGRKRYTTVAQRNEVFREFFGMTGRLKTEVLEANEDHVLMLAYVEFFIDGKWELIANGYAEEKRNASQVNRTSALENAETSAIGRALANLGLHGGEFASSNEVENAIHQQEGKKNAKISKDEHDALEKQILAAGADIPKFLEFFNIDELAELPAADLLRAQKLLAKKTKEAVS